MKNLIRLFLILLIVSAGVGLHTSCSEDSDCSITGRAMINCTLYALEMDGNTIKEVHKDTLDSLTVTALGTDSIIINNQKKVHTLMLPLRYTKDSTILIFHYAYLSDPTLCDTIRIKQNNTPYFESMDCGYSMKQSILGLSHSQIELDSIYILNKQANTDGTENLKLFYRYRD